MSTITKPRRRWTDETIGGALRELSAELGHFPTRAELVARGMRGLWEAMRTYGGVDAWREKMQRQVMKVEPASYDEIAARAYQLYEEGQPGDAMTHWLVAERQLSPAPS